MFCSLHPAAALLALSVCKQSRASLHQGVSAHAHTYGVTSETRAGPTVGWSTCTCRQRAFERARRIIEERHEVALPPFCPALRGNKEFVWFAAHMRDQLCPPPCYHVDTSWRSGRFSLTSLSLSSFSSFFVRSLFSFSSPFLLSFRECLIREFVIERSRVVCVSLLRSPLS